MPVTEQFFWDHRDQHLRVGPAAALQERGGGEVTFILSVSPPPTFTEGNDSSKYSQNERLAVRARSGMIGGDSIVDL